MTISPISSVNGAGQAGSTSGVNQGMQAFKALEQDLQSGNMSSAQTDFATFMKAAQNAPAGSKLQAMINPSTQTGKDLQALQSSLQSGNVTAAQQALTSVKQDFQQAMQSQSAGQTGHHHHHHGARPAATTDTTSSATASSGQTGSVVNVQA